MTPFKIPTEVTVISLDGVLVSVDLLRSLLLVDGIRRQVTVQEGVIAALEAHREGDVVIYRECQFLVDGNEVLEFLGVKATPETQQERIL